MKELPINLDDLALSFERPPELGLEALLDLETGEIVELFEDGDLRERVEAHPERYADIPILRTQDEYRLMERFAETRSDDEDRRELLRALQGKGAFGRFRDAVSRARQSDEWHRFRDEQVELQLREWLAGIGVATPPRTPRAQIVAPAAAPPPAPPLPGLVQMLIFGGKPELRGDKVDRVVEAASPDLARKYFVGIARSICAHIGEDWRKRFVENTSVFERERFVLRVDGKRVVLTVTVDPAVVKLFG